MNVAELKALLEEADDEAQVLLLDPETDSECEDDAGVLVAATVLDIEEDADGNPVFVLGVDDEDDEEEDEGDEPTGEEPEP